MTEERDVIGEVIAEDKAERACATIEMRRLESGRLVATVSRFDAGILKDGLNNVYSKPAPQPPELGGEPELLRLSHGPLCMVEDEEGDFLSIEDHRASLAPYQAEIERLRYKAELYDEVWGLATGLGYLNVTTAISELRARLVERDARVAELEGLLRDYPGQTIGIYERAWRATVRVALSKPTEGAQS